MTNPQKVLAVPMLSYKKREVPAQVVITAPEGQYFQSHRKVVAFIPSDGGQVVLDRAGWKVSKTTGKYRNKFLRETREETERKVREHVYALANLN